MITAKSKAWLGAVVAVSASFLISHLGFLLFPSLLDTWNLQATDLLYGLRQKWRSEAFQLHDKVACVVLDQESFDALGSLYLDREWCSRVVRALGATGASAQAWDVVFGGEKDAKKDEELIRATREAGNVFYSLLFQTSLELPGETSEDSFRQEPAHSWVWSEIGNDYGGGLLHGSRPRPTFSALGDAAVGQGHINHQPDRDGFVRRIPLITRYDGGWVPNLSFAAVCHFLQVGPELISIEVGKHILIKEAVLPGGETNDITIPIDDRGNILVNYLLPWSSVEPISFVEVCEDVHDYPEVWREKFEGKIVFIGDVSMASHDIGAVPTDPAYPLVGGHVSIANSILKQDFLRELSLRETWSVELGLCVVLLLLSILGRSSSFFFASALVAIVVVFGFAGAMIWGGMVGNLVRPILMLTCLVGLTLGRRYILEEKEKTRLRSMFDAYFPPAVTRRLISQSQLFQPMGNKKELTVLFSDIKNFTQMSERLDPLEVQNALNEYFGAMVEIVFRHGGTVDKFIGDGLMVFFGDPEPQADHALRCVRAGIEMQQKSRDLREAWKRRGGMDLVIRIGIHTGPMVVGNMGSARRLSYTVVGASVNLASRLESSAPPGGILISETTFDQVKDEVSCCFHDKLQVKGVENRVTSYLVSS